MARKSNRSALMALAAAGGLWAWRNREKIQGWLNQQRSNANNDLPGYMLNEGNRQHDAQAPTDSTDVQRDPYGSGI